MSIISLRGRKVRPNFGRIAYWINSTLQRTVSRAALSLKWARRFAYAAGCNAVSLLLGGALTCCFAICLGFGIGIAALGSMPDAGIKSVFPVAYPTAVKPDASPQKPPATRATRGIQRDNPSTSKAEQQKHEAAHNTVIRLVCFGVAVLGFYGAYQFHRRLTSWWNGQGRFGLRAKGRAAFEWTGGVFFACFCVMAGAGLLYYCGGLIVSKDAAILEGIAKSGSGPWIANIPPTVEHERADALLGFCFGLLVFSAALWWFFWLCSQFVSGVRSLFAAKTSTL